MGVEGSSSSFPVAVGGKIIPDAGAEGFAGVEKVLHDITHDAQEDIIEGTAVVRVGFKQYPGPDGRFEITGVNVPQIEDGINVKLEPPVDYGV